MAFDKSKFIKKFIEEARDHIEKLNKGLLALEKNPEDMDSLNSIFRSAHTIKGSSRMMKFSSISDLAHKLEDAFDGLRSKKIPYTKELSNLFFKVIDLISGMLDKIASGDENIELNIEIIEELETSITKSQIAEKSEKQPETSDEKKENQQESVNQKISKHDETTKNKAIVVSAPKKEEFKDKIKKEEAIRIDSSKLDDLINHMGEIVSSYSGLKRSIFNTKEIEDSLKKSLDDLNSLRNNSQFKDIDIFFENTQLLALNIKKYLKTIKNDINIQEPLIKELHEKSLNMRMLPLSTIFDGFHREVRDIAREFGKDIDFIVEGGETEIDKKIIEKLTDPMLHMLRNSIDHGIEPLQDRINAGKPPKGLIHIIAYYESGSVIIEIIDDGRGISIKNIKEKAIKKKFFDEKTIENMSESELTDIIFIPGFSTSSIITDLSGRGVGMDVVKTNIVEQLKGTILISTKEEKGTTFLIRLPLTLAVLKLFLFTVSNTIFAVPSHSVRELVMISESDIFKILEKRAISLREEIIPLEEIYLILKLKANEALIKKKIFILIVSTGKESLGLIIDNLVDEVDMVIKPLPIIMGGVQAISGFTLWDNKIINVLNIPFIIKMAKDINYKTPIKELIPSSVEKELKILVVDDSLSTREIEKNILEAYGYNVDIAINGLEAIEKTKDIRYDVVITDVEMPQMDGFSLTENLRKDSYYKDIPIIIVTSRANPEDKLRGIKVGANAYIIKGEFDQSLLLDTIHKLIG
ncbi:MAG: hybrid sensor histidine kinase/response regulator [Desulfobacterales bacterium]|nr:hybrid sensor histidine kinase/response regulator [Desulfobacterales bacterium]